MNEHERGQATADLVQQVKEKGGYTWEQVAQILGVPRRTVHMWMSGREVSDGYRGVLLQVLEQIEEIESAGIGNKRTRFLALLDERRSQRSSSPDDVNRPPSTYSPHH